MSAMNPGGVRIGTPAMTSRGLREADFEAVADLLHEVRSIQHDGNTVRYQVQGVCARDGRMKCNRPAGRLVLLPALVMQ
jgi:glycine/serine hydroxymethyltransferase